MQKPLAIIVGSGKGLGLSLAETFSKAGYQIVGLNRSLIDTTIPNCSLKQLDTSDPKAVKNSLADIFQQYGPPSVVIHNPAQLYIKPFLETPAQEFETTWKAMLLSAVNVLHQSLPLMVEQGSGNVIFSGATASSRGGPNFSAFVSAKFALRGLAQSLAREYQKQGIHITHVILDGILDTPRSHELHAMDPSLMMSTKDVAEVYLQIVQQKPSTWTHELDLRPKTETF